jgi:O-antigen ligase
MVRGSGIEWAMLVFGGVAIGIYALGISVLPAPFPLLFLIAALFLFLAMIVGNARKLLLAIIILDIPFQLDNHFFYNSAAAELGAIGGLGLSVTTICLGILYVFWFKDLLTRAHSLPDNLFRLSLPLMVYFGFVALSTVVAKDIALSFFELALLFQNLLLFVYIVGTLKTHDDFIFVVTMLLISVILESVIMFSLIILGHGFEFAGIAARIDSGMRVSGTFGSPNYAGIFFELLLAPAIAVLFTRIGKPYKFLATIAFILGSISLVLTFSRGGWLAFLFSVLVLCVFSWKRGWLKPSFFIATGIALAILILFFHDAIFTRIFGYDFGSAYSRLPLMKLAFNMIKDHPLLGVGINNFSVRIEEYDPGGIWIHVVHNKYLLVAAETGFISLIPFLWFLLATLRRGWEITKFNGRLISPLALAFTAAFLGSMIHMLVDVYHGRPALQLLLLIAGLIAAMYNSVKK